MDVRELLQAAAAGDSDAWSALVARYNGLIWAVARSHRLATADAADVTQTTWLRLVEHLDDIRDPERLGAWLATTARHECLRMLRLGQRHVLTDALEPFQGADGMEMDGHVIAGERDAALRRAYATLDERCQVLLRLLMSDPSPSYVDIGAYLGIAVGTIGPLRARCLERLRVRIASFGITTAAEDSG